MVLGFIGVGAKFWTSTLAGGALAFLLLGATAGAFVKVTLAGSIASPMLTYWDCNCLCACASPWTGVEALRPKQLFKLFVLLF